MLDQPSASSSHDTPTDLSGVQLAQLQPDQTPAQTEIEPEPPIEQAMPVLGVPTEIAPPASAGGRSAVPVRPNQAILLEDEAFDPQEAIYVPEGDDLVITLADGRVVVLVDFFAYPDAPPTLAVLGGPAVAADTLLARAIEAQQVPIEPAAATAPEPTVVLSEGGQYRPYDPGAIGPGLDPLGPLGPTDIGFRVPEFIEGGGPLDTLGEPVPPGPLGPEIAVEANQARLAEISFGFPFKAGGPIPTLKEGHPLGKDALPNVGVDRGNVTLDADREVTIIFQDEIAASKNSLGAYVVDSDGFIRDARLVFEHVEHADRLELPSGDTAPRPGGGPLSPGDSVSLGVVPAGFLVGVFLVADGFGELKGLPQGGHLEFRNDKGGTFNINTDAGAPKLVYVVGDKEFAIHSNVFHSIDSTPGDIVHNPMNAGGFQQVISGFNDFGYLPAFPDLGILNGELVIAFEDLKPGQKHYDADFNDAIVRIAYSAVPVTVLEEVPVARELSIDSAGVLLAAASVSIAAADLRPGDFLRLDPDQFTVDVDGNIVGTGLTLVDDGSGGSLIVEGLADSATYEAVLRAVLFGNDSDDLSGIDGARQIAFQLTDENGASSGIVEVGFTVVPPLVGTAGDDVLDNRGNDDGPALAGRGGDDELYGHDAGDILDGGDGFDLIVGGDGDDILIGGPGSDLLYGGPGADIFAFLTLADRTDVILDFNADEGDSLNLEVLFGGSFDASNADDFIRFQRFDLDVDGDGTPNDIVVVEVDVDGPGDDFQFLSLVVLTDPTGVTTVDQMVAGGNIVA